MVRNLPKVSIYHVNPKKCKHFVNTAKIVQRIDDHSEKRSNHKKKHKPQS